MKTDSCRPVSSGLICPVEETVHPLFILGGDMCVCLPTVDSDQHCAATSEPRVSARGYQWPLPQTADTLHQLLPEVQGQSRSRLGHVPGYVTVKRFHVYIILSSFREIVKTEAAAVEPQMNGCNWGSAAVEPQMNGCNWGSANHGTTHCVQNSSLMIRWPQQGNHASFISHLWVESSWSACTIGIMNISCSW